jgi:hypothetical protein
MSAVAVRPVPETQYALWNRLVAESPMGSPYSTPEYLDALCSGAGGTFRILGLWRGEELIGGIGLYERASAWGRYVWPRLLLYYNGPILRHFDTKYPSQRTSRTVEALGALADALAGEYASLMLKSRSALDDLRPLLSRNWTVHAGYSYEVPLTDLAEQWGRVEQNLRRLVERARQQGLQFSDDDDFAGFYALHQSTLGRRGVASYLPREGFARWFERLKSQGLCRLYSARLPDGRIAASQLVLTGQHPVSHTISAAADPALQNTGANPFLRWRAFEVLAGAGYTGNDLTDASLNPVTHFKAQLGGKLCLTLVAECHPSWRWRAGTRLEQGYRSMRRLASDLYHRVRDRSRPA